MLIFLLVVAVQCNLSGQPYWMMTDDAPDPRDVFWRNVGADRLTIESRKILVQCVLLLGILAWGTIATCIKGFTLKTLGSFPLGLSPSVVQGKPIQTRIHVTTKPVLELTTSYFWLYFSRLSASTCCLSDFALAPESIFHVRYGVQSPSTVKCLDFISYFFTTCIAATS